MKHTYDPEHELDVCVTCGMYEGGLTTDCSGEKVTMAVEDDVYAGKLDYRDSEGWVNKLNPTNQSWLRGRIREMLAGKEGAAKHKNELMLRFGIDKDQYREVEKQVLKESYNG